ncbi:MAG: acetate--CoA ligase family protein [Actinomycetota bacterium]|nr:acetate--CoA ligase family protein [Actinomycetota bacterium]
MYLSGIAQLPGDDAIRDDCNEIKTIKLLKGARGEALSNKDSIVEVLLRISQLVMDFPGNNRTDINPLLS